MASLRTYAGWAGGVLLIVVLASCHAPPGPVTKSRQKAEAATAAPVESPSAAAPTATEPGAQATEKTSPAETKPAAAAAPAEKREYSSRHDNELKAILDLARKGKWAEAERQANALHELDPQDSAVQRVYSWVTKQSDVRRAQALEAKIREIDSDNSVFNPTVPDLLLEGKDRGLPPRKDVRDAIDQIESGPYVPGRYGRTNYLRGPLFDLESQEGRMAKVLDQEISVHLDNVPLEAIIFNVGTSNRINFVADKSLPAFKQTLSANFDKVPLSEFLDYVSRNLEVQFQVGDNLVWIVDGKDPKKKREETRFYQLRRGFVLPAQMGSGDTVLTKQLNPANQQVTAITEVRKISQFVNDNAPTMPSLEVAITNFFTGSKYFIDYERNTIVARGTREELEVLEGIIREFDRPIQQVLIEARFVTVTQPAFMQLGVLWETGRSFAAARSAYDYTGIVSTDSQRAGVGLGLQEFFTNILGRATLSATISALEQSGESQTLSAPRLTVLNNRPATIHDGKVQYYYEEYTVKTTITERTSASSFVPSGKPTKLTAGVQLDVLASIGGDGRSILLALSPTVNQDVKLVTFATLTDVDASGNVISSFDIKLPESRTQELSTRVVVRSGETVVMGGVLEREQSTYVESVPVLGSLPLIGPLFRRRTEIDKPRYLLIFVTATIISESGEFLIYEDTER